MCIIEVYEYTIDNLGRVPLPKFFGIEEECESECPCGTVVAYKEQQGGNARRSCDLLNSKRPRRVNEDALPNHWLYTHFPTRITLGNVYLDTYSLELDPSIEVKAEEHTGRSYVETDYWSLRILLDPTIPARLGYDVIQITQIIEEAREKVNRFAMKPIDVIPEASNLHETSIQGYLLHWKTTNDLVVIGDLHGSYHTFWRHLLRLRSSGIITSLQNLQLRRGVTLVFTGDVVDRGLYALDIMILILKLIINNRLGAVIFNRGNHEDWNVTMQYGFYAELQKKFPDGVGTDCTNKAWHILTTLQRFWSTCPCAVVIENTKTRERLWISHGGIPLTDISFGVGQTCIPLEPNQVKQCLWYDFCTPKDGDNAKHTTMGKLGRVQIMPAYLRAFMERHKISFIIRGHQDAYANTYMLSNHVVDSANVCGSRFDLVGRYHQKQGLIHVSSEHEVRGPIARVYTNSRNTWLSTPPLTWSTPEGDVEVYPVIVVATCTETGRLHSKDSLLYVNFSSSNTHGIGCVKK